MLQPLARAVSRGRLSVGGRALLGGHGRSSLLPVGVPASPCSTTRTPTTRSYNKQAYRQAKKAAKALKNQDDISFADAVDILRTYGLRQGQVGVLATLQLGREVVGLPEAVSGSDSSPSPTGPTLPEVTATRTFKGQVTLPHAVIPSGAAAGSKEADVVLVFAKGPQAQQAKELGAHIVGGEELIPGILSGKLHFTRCLSTKSMFPHVIKIAKVLGPKGLMPSPGKGTVSEDVASMMATLSASTPFVSDGAGRIQVEIGRLSWDAEQLYDNMMQLLKAVMDVKPPKTDASHFIAAKILSLPHSVAMELPKKAVSTTAVSGKLSVAEAAKQVKALLL